MGTRAKQGEHPSPDLSGLGDVLSRLRLPKEVRDHLKNYEIWAQWDQIVGPELARVTSPLELKAKTLSVSVVHQAWAHQLHFLTPSILTKIRSLCPRSHIEDLHFKVGKVRPSKIEKTESELAREKKEAHLKELKEFGGPIQLSERQEMTLRAVEDDDLRRAIRKAMEASVRRALVEGWTT